MMGGYTRVVPDEDRLFKTKKQFEDESGGLHGRPGRRDAGLRGAVDRRRERHRAGDRDCPADGDRVRDEPTLGPLAFGKKDELVFLGREISEQRNYSDEIAYQIDQEIRELIDAAHERAKAIIDRSISTSWSRSPSC